MAKLREMICDAVREPYTPTEEEILIQAKRLYSYVFTSHWPMGDMAVFF